MGFRQGFVSRMYKYNYKHYQEGKDKQPNRKWPRNVGRWFIKQKIQMANRYTKLCSTLLGMRKTRVKSTVRYQYASCQMTELESLLTAGAAKSVRPCWTKALASPG